MSHFTTRLGRLAILLMLVGCIRPEPKTGQPMLPSPLVGETDDERADEQEWLPNNDPFQKRPVWLPAIDIKAGFAGDWWSDIAVDSRNISHIVYMESTVFGGGEGGGGGGDTEFGGFGRSDGGSESTEVSTLAPAPVFEFSRDGKKKLLPFPLGKKFPAVLERSKDRVRVKVQVEAQQDPGDAECQIFKIHADKPLPEADGPNGGRFLLRLPQVSERDSPKGFKRFKVSPPDQGPRGGGFYKELEILVVVDLIYYKNDRYETREANSFSDRFLVCDKPSTPFTLEAGSYPTIAIDKDDNIHVAWTVFEGENFILRYRLFDRELHQWDEPMDLAEANINQLYPHIACDSQGIVHIGFTEWNAALNQYYIRYIASTQAKPKDRVLHFMAASQRVDADPTGLQAMPDKPRISIGSDDVPVMAWVDISSELTGPTQSPNKAVFSRRVGGAWSTVERVSLNEFGHDVFQCDVASHSGNLQHFVYDQYSEEPGPAVRHIMYRRRVNGVLLPAVKKVNETPTFCFLPRVLADSQGQPHVQFSYQEGVASRQAYAAMKNRPFDDDHKPKWGRREPIEVLPGIPDYCEMVLNQNDNIYSTYSRYGLTLEGLPAHTPVWFSRTIEPNLGSQDGLGMFGWGPGASANAVNGNVLFTLGVFSSRGVGFATSFTLIYNSLKWDKSTLAPGWMHNYHLTLTEHNTVDPKTIDVVFADGRRVVYAFDPIANRFLQAEPYFAEFSSIQKDVPDREGQMAPFLLEDKFGLQVVFDSRGRLLRFLDTQAQPNKLVLEYEDAPESPKTEIGLILDTSNPEKGAGIVPVRIRDSANRVTTLDYDDKDRLIKVTDPAGKEYTIQYEPILKGKIKQVKFPTPDGSQEVAWTFKYWAQNNSAAGEKQRMNLMSEIFTPRGTLQTYSWLLKFRKNNAAIASIDPPELSVKDDVDIDAPNVMVADPNERKRTLSYVWEPWRTVGEVGLERERPNTVKPDESHNVQVRYEAEEEPPVEVTIPVVGNNVPRVEFKTVRDNVWKMEVQYLRSLVDNQTDPNGFYVRRWFNSTVSGPPVTQPDFRNLSVFVDKKGAATKTTYHSASNPGWVKDNVFEVFESKTFTSKDASAPGPEFHPAFETTYTNDGLNRVKVRKDARGKETTDDHDLSGNVIRRTYPQVTLADGTPQDAFEQMQYDSRGRTTKFFPAECGEITYSYNDSATGLVTDILYPEGTSPERFTYDVMGNTLSRQLPLGSTTTYELDNLYRVVKTNLPASTAGTAVIETEYDVDSNVIKSIAPSGTGSTTIEYTTDRLGRQTETKRLSVTARAEYDREGNARRSFDFNGNLVSKALVDTLSRGTDFQANFAPKDAPNQFAVAKAGYDPNSCTTSMDQQPGAPEVRSVTAEYEARWLQERVNLPNSTFTHAKFNENGDMIRSALKLGNDILTGSSISLDDRRRLKQVTQLPTQVDPGEGTGLAGPISKVLLDKDSAPTVLIDPRDNRTTRILDCRKRVKEVKDGNGATVVKTVLNEDDDVIEEQIPDPNTGAFVTNRRYTYTPRKEVEDVFDAFGNRLVHNVYDLAGNVTEQIDVDGVRTTYSYDGLNRLIEVVRDADGLQVRTQHVYDNNGNRVQLIDGRGLVYEFKYTKANQLQEIKYPSINGAPSNVEQWEYNAFGQVSRYTDPNGKVTTFTYNNMGWLTEERHESPTSTVVITRSYLPSGQLETISDGSVSTLYEYDDLLRVKKVTTTLVGSGFVKAVQYEYDAAGNRTKLIDPEGAEYTYSYDSNNRLTSIVREKNANVMTVATFEYTLTGQNKRTVKGNGLDCRYTFNSRLETTRIEALDSSGKALQTIAYTYRADGNRSRVDYEHLKVSAFFGYDALDRLVSELWTGNAGLSSGYINQLTSDIGNESTDYSAEACATPVDVPAIGPHYQAYSYDGAGNRLTLRGVGRSSDYVYDSENRLVEERPFVVTKVSGNLAASSTQAGFTADRVTDGVLDDSVDAAGAWKSESAAVEHSVELSWQDAKIVTQVRLYVPTGPGEIKRFKIQHWNGSGWQDSNIVAPIGPESAGSGWYKTSTHANWIGIEPVSTTKVRFVQDVGGGAESQPNVAMLNEMEVYEIVAGNPIAYSYDANGNQTRRTQNGVIEEFGFDYANRLTTYKRTGNSGVEADFHYVVSSQGNRILKHDLRLNTEEAYAYDGRDVVGDYSRSGGAGGYTLARTYAQGLGIDSKIARIDDNAGVETFTYYLGDALGSVNHQVDATGAVVKTTLGNAWGEDLYESAGLVDRHGFTQRERDSESGVMHFRARFYDPRIGRFGGKDPVIGNRTTGHYIYATNNPAMRVDPLGTQDEAKHKELTYEEAIMSELEHLHRLQDELLSTWHFGLIPFYGWNEYTQRHARILQLEGKAEKAKATLDQFMSSFAGIIGQIATDMSPQSVASRVLLKKDYVTGEEISDAEWLLEIAFLSTIYLRGLQIENEIILAEIRSSQRFGKAVEKITARALERARERATKLLHKITLGKDPARGGTFLVREANTGERLESVIGRLEREPTGDVDWIAGGKRYDAVSPVDHPNFKLKEFAKSFRRHLATKKEATLVVDLVDVSPQRRTEIENFLSTLSKEENDRVIILKPKQ